MASRKVVVIGCSGFGRESLDVVEAMQVDDSGIQILGVLDDSPSVMNLQRLASRGVDYLGRIDEWLAAHPTKTRFVLGIGNPQARRALAKKLAEAGLAPLTIIHPTAVLGTGCQIGAGTVICAGAVVSTNVVLGNHVHINPNATIGHDAILDEFVSVNPGAVISGEVHVKTEVLVGANSLVLQNLVIGEQTIIGASAVVTKNVPGDVVVKGIPGTWREF